MTLQRLILGKQWTETEAKKRKVLLGAYLIFTFLGLDLFFLVINTINPLGDARSLMLGTVISLLCLALINRGWIDTAIFLHLIRSNLIAFYFSLIDVDPYKTGTYLYFISSSLGALAVFGYQERWKGIGFSLFSFSLFFIAFFNPSQFSIEEAHFYFIVNFSIVLLIGLLIMMFFDRLVVDSEHDIAKKNAELLEANKELIKANEELDRFVYSASHDLRAPLSSMLGLVEIAQHSKDSNEVSQYLNMIRGRVNVLDSFIRQIVDYSRNSRLIPKIEPVDVKGLIHEVIEQLRFLQGFESVKITLDFPEGWLISSEKYRLKIIFENLISNAIKYRDPSQANCQLHIRGWENDTGYHFEIKDNGIGISDDHLDKIFDMFYRANENSQGSGLGLYIVKETTAKLNGAIDVKSQPGNGSAFTLRLPKTKSLT